MLFIEPDNIREILDSGFVESAKKRRDADVLEVPDFSHQLIPRDLRSKLGGCNLHAMGIMASSPSTANAPISAIQRGTLPSPLAL